MGTEGVRNGTQPIQANATRFPNGIKAVADYVHALGLKLGIYSDSGFRTCAKYTASLGYEEIDAQQFAAWGVDLLKYDNCFSVPPANQSVRSRYARMSAALNATGRPILFSMCDWGVSSPWLYAQTVANTWRATQDISLDIQATWGTVMNNLEGTTSLARFAGPGAWNDADMLEIGWPGGAQLSDSEQRAHFALWAILKSPLIFGNDLGNMTRDTLSILKSREVIAINQDPLGVAGDLVWKQGPQEIYAAPLQGGSRAVVMFNRHQQLDPLFNVQNLTVFWASIGIAPNATCTVRDLYGREDLGNFTSYFTSPILAHGAGVLKITPLEADPNGDAWRPWDCNPSIDYFCFASGAGESSA
ncbi:g2480 [Coccomyxa viridis]|uniref:Alpha-galactosidase n=1 Tax=Coccomyxa viridis TaxID=1274662 RepID=A0ABP1FP76_9CHLO